MLTKSVPSDSLEEGLVTAVMITGLHEARYPLARIAIDCFRAQTYRNRELLIVNHGMVSLASSDENIRELRVTKKDSDTVGDLRNIALAEAKGEAIVCWDDDDWFSPDRIAVQYKAYCQAGGDCAVVLRNGIRFNLVDQSARYVRRPEGMPSSILHSGRVPFKYQSMLKSSDEVFLGCFGRRVGLDNDPSLYIRTYHGMNLWNGDHIMKGMVGAKYRNVFQVNPSDRDLLIELLQKHESVYRVFLAHAQSGEEA